MEIVNIQAAKTHLSKLVEKVSRGEEVILAKAGQPVARLIPYSEAKKARKGGLLKGQVVESEDCWSSSDDGFATSLEGSLFHASSSNVSQLKVSEGKG